MLVGTLALFVVSLGYGVIVPMLPRLAGATDAAGLLSIVYAVYAAAKIGAQVPGGVWVDRAGALRVLRVALAVFTASLAGFLVDGGVAWFALVRAVEGAATGVVYPAVCALAVAGAAPERAGRALGTTIGVGSAGLLVGPALAGAFGEGGGETAILVTVVAAALVTGLAFREQAVVAPEAPRTLGGEVARLAGLARNVAFVALMLPVAFNKLTFSAMQGLLPLHGERLGLPMSMRAGGILSITGLFAVTGVCFGVAQPLGGALADRVPPRRVVLALSPPLVVALAALWRARTGAAFSVAYAAYVTLSSFIFTATLKHAARAYGTRDTYGGVFGLLGTLTDLFTIVGPLAFVGGYAALGGDVFLVMAGVGTAAGLLYALLSAK